MVFALKTIRLLARDLQALGRDRVRDVEDQGAVGRQAAVGRLCQAIDQITRHSLPCSLIRDRRIGEAVADDRAAGREGGLDDAGDMIGTAGEDEQGADDGLHALFQHGLSDLLGELGAAGLARDDDVATAGAERVGDELDVRRLAGAVDSFERHELAARTHRLSWYLVTARLCSAKLRENWLEPSPRET